MSRKKPKSKNSESPNIRGTYYLSRAGVQTEEIRSLILRRRLQLLVHSHIYYDLNYNLVTDETWGRWAQELVKLQREYPLIADRVDYSEAFKDFDGSTGFDLPYRQPEIMSKAKWLVDHHKEEDHDKPPARHPANRANSRADVIRVQFP